MVKLTRDQDGLDPSCGLRVGVRDGGCSGFEYVLDFEHEPRADDVVLEYDDLRVFVDSVSCRYLDGTTLDFSLGMSGTGFKFDNPAATGSCGCGSSFTV